MNSEERQRQEDRAGMIAMIMLCVIVLIVAGIFAIALAAPYFEAKAWNRLTGGNATYWDAAWTELRVDCSNRVGGDRTP